MIEQFFILLPLVIGAYITFSLLKLPDFSIESAYLFGAVVSYLCRNLELPIVIFGAIFGGVFVAFTVSALNTLLNIPFLLRAIIANGLFHGVTQYLLGTSQKSFHILSSISSYTICLGITLALILGFGLLIYSELGYALAIYGNNPKFFENQGISSKYVVSVGLALGYASSALSGFLFALCNGFVDLTMNYGIILLCLTSLILGKSSYVYFFQKTRQNLVIPFLGLCIYCVLQKLLLKVGLPLKYFNAFQALCIVATLTLFKKTKQISFDHLGV